MFSQQCKSWIFFTLLEQATAEQIRLAQMISDHNDDFEEKVKQVSRCTFFLSCCLGVPAPFVVAPLHLLTRVILYHLLCLALDMYVSCVRIFFLSEHIQDLTINDIRPVIFNDQIINFDTHSLSSKFRKLKKQVIVTF